MALQGVTIELDNNVMPVYDTPYLAENAYEFLSEACPELKEDSEVVKASFTAGDDIKNGNYLGALNGFIMTVHEAFTHNRHLILDPYVFRVAVQIQLDSTANNQSMRNRRIMATSFISKINSSQTIMKLSRKRSDQGS